MNLGLFLVINLLLFSILGVPENNELVEVKEREVITIIVGEDDEIEFIDEGE